MPSTRTNPRPRQEKAAIYRICVQGYLAESWSERLGGVTISSQRREDGGAETTLVGQVVDQTALLGILNTLHDLHLPLLSVAVEPSGPDPP